MKRTFDEANDLITPDKNKQNRIRALNVLKKCNTKPFIAVDLDYTVITLLYYQPSIT